MRDGAHQRSYRVRLRRDGDNTTLRMPIRDAHSIPRVHCTPCELVHCMRICGVLCVVQVMQRSIPPPRVFAIEPAVAPVVHHRGEFEAPPCPIDLYAIIRQGATAQARSYGTCRCIGR